MPDKRSSVVRAEEILQAILALPKGERARLFDRMAREPSLAHYVAPPSGVQSSFAETAESGGDADYVIIFDGGSEGNPGRGYGSYALIDAQGRQRLVRLELGGNVTNNEAEYDTLIAALEDLLQQTESNTQRPSKVTVEVRGDSRLVLRQVRGEWKSKDERMRRRRDRVRALLTRFGSYRLVEQRREESVKVLGH
jgi:ribonuclease HI